MTKIKGIPIKYLDYVIDLIKSEKEIGYEQGKKDIIEKLKEFDVDGRGVLFEFTDTDLRELMKE